MKGGLTMTTPMSLGDLASLADSCLESVIFDQMVAKMDDWNDQRAVVDKWSEPERVCFVVNATANEVFNGGFNQFFYNTAGRQFYDIAAHCFTTVGADPWAKIVQHACDMIDSDEGKTIVARWGDTPDSFAASYQDNPLNDFDEQFFALDDKTLSDLIIAYIRANLAAFASQ